MKNQIILIDDDVDLLGINKCFFQATIRELFQTIPEVSFVNITIKTYSDPKKAIKYILENLDSICLVVSDQEMPKGTEPTGTQLLYSIFAQTKGQELPVLVLYCSESSNIMSDFVQQRAFYDRIVSLDKGYLIGHKIKKIVVDLIIKISSLEGSGKCLVTI